MVIANFNSGYDIQQNTQTTNPETGGGGGPIASIKCLARPPTPHFENSAVELKKDLFLSHHRKIHM